MKQIGIFLIMGLFIMACKSPQYRQANLDEARSLEDGVSDENFFSDQNNGQPVKRQGQADIIDADESSKAGFAAWYGKELHGKPTASGENFDMYKYTAAHRNYTMGSIVLVKNLENGKKQLVRINDRGPYVEGRIIDVSYATARDLGFAEKGVARVEVELIREGNDDFIQKAQLDQKKEETLVEEDLEAEPEEKTPSSSYVFIDGLRPRYNTVQVGAFKKRANAERYRADMEDQYTTKGFIATKGKWHYVWVGDFKSKSRAKLFIKKLKGSGQEAIFRDPNI